MGRGKGPLAKEGKLYFYISAVVPEFQITPLLMEPVRPCTISYRWLSVHFRRTASGRRG